MFLLRLNHLIAVLAISEKAPAHSPMAWLLAVLLVSWLSGVYFRKLPGATSTLSFCKAQFKF